MDATSPDIAVRHRLSSPHWSAEPALVAAVILIASLIASQGAKCQLLLSLFYLPVVISAFYLGRYRSGALALFTVLLAGAALSWSLLSATGTLLALDVLAFILWGGTLGLVALVTGTLSDAWRETMSQLSETNRREAQSDALTGLLNRRGFDSSLLKQVRQAQQKNTAVALLMVDIDRFKDLNDRYGHDAGDKVLADMASILRQVTRHESDLVARFGGEEFAIVLSGNPSVAVASELAERIREAVHAARFHFNELSLRITASVGIAQLQPSEDAHSLLRRADAALYCSKESGRNCVHFHNGLKNVRMGAIGEAPHTAESLTELHVQDSSVDEATGMPTIHVYLGELRRRLAECQRYGTKLTVAVIGLDSYEDAAQQDVRAAKDLMTTIASLTTSILRDSDMTARCGESSLCLMLPHTNAETCFVPLERLRQKANEYKDARYPDMSFSVSIGVAQFLADIDSCERVLFERASHARTAGYAASGNCIFMHDGNDCVVANSASFAAQPANRLTHLPILTSQ